jgi:hypothetical protein
MEKRGRAGRPPRAPARVGILTLTDDPAEATDRILAAAQAEFGLRWERAPKARRLLGEGDVRPR